MEDTAKQVCLKELIHLEVTLIRLRDTGMIPESAYTTRQKQISALKARLLYTHKPIHQHTHQPIHPEGTIGPWLFHQLDHHEKQICYTLLFHQKKTLKEVKKQVVWIEHTVARIRDPSCVLFMMPFYFSKLKRLIDALEKAKHTATQTKQHIRNTLKAWQPHAVKWTSDPTTKNISPLIWLPRFFFGLHKRSKQLAEQQHQSHLLTSEVTWMKRWIGWKQERLKAVAHPQGGRFL